ncbi:MAG: serine hydrolase [Bryobacteraceae bacterium]|jgi:CubicO group peptidase (beta-lactamase class C family)
MLRTLILFACLQPLLAQPAAYFPARRDWQRSDPAAAGMDQAKIDEAIAWHRAHETKNPRDLRRSHDLSFAREAYGDPLGPFQPRGEPTGVIVRHGHIVAEWGEPLRADMTFSVTKSFLSSVVGLAFDHGLIRDLNDLVKDYVPGEYFASGHNSRITWDHLLRQTSDWEGTLWGKPDWADRPPKDIPFEQYIQRQHAEPGTTWKYNDIRVNLLAYSILQVWRRPLQQVLRDYLMDPIGASSTWRWYGYDNAWVPLDGVMVQSPTGGGHYGGGMVISAEDMARFGLLTLHRGQWNGKQILSEQWVKWALTPTKPNPGYGFMNWYLNTGKKMLPDAPENVFCHVGNCANVIYVDPDLDLVAVVRWIDSGDLNGFVARVRAGVK